jgi:hypothetical protein
MNLKILKQIEKPKQEIILEISSKWLNLDYMKFVNLFGNIINYLKQGIYEEFED